jgi:hypothetical protein
MPYSHLTEPLLLSWTAPVESRIFFVCPVGIVRLLCRLVLYPDYRVTIAPVALITKACCVVVAQMATHALTSDTLELVLTWIAVGYSSP